MTQAEGNFSEKGLGTKACIYFLKNEYGAERVSVPVELKNIIAKRFRGKLGFVFSDNVEDGYIFMRLTL